MNKVQRRENPVPKAAASLKIVGIGASAGGLEAFSELLSNLPEGGNVAYILVQHLDPTHRSLLSEILSKSSVLPVCEIQHGMRVEAGKIYVIPPNTELTLEKRVLKLQPRRKGGLARSIDHFLVSLAEDQGENAVGVILSGAGSDGAKGIKAVRMAGGHTFAQRESTAKYDSMPRAAIATGVIDFVLPPAKIAGEIARLVASPAGSRTRAAANARKRSEDADAAFGRAFSPPARAGGPLAVRPQDPSLRKLFNILQAKTGADFSLYRATTIKRRLQRRLAATGAKNVEKYIQILASEASEVDALYQDFLIGVTRFFRNPGVFETLKRKVFPRLVKTVVKGEPLRVWVPGCSTGQEAYSIAMAFTEFAENQDVAVRIQIFASDINNGALEFARNGRYGAREVEQVSAGRRRRFFEPDGAGYRVTKTIRDLVMFARQNVVSDPPFTRVDLVSCRNMLIYLEPSLQQKIIPTFHYALRPGGCLVLGSSETAGAFSELFEAADKRNKIFTKRAVASRMHYQPRPSNPAVTYTPPSNRAIPDTNPTEILREADRLTLARFSPAGVVVNASGEILQFRGDATRYLDLPAGKATYHLGKMVRDGLVVPLNRAIQKARKENRVVREKDIRVEGRGRVDLTVSPLKGGKDACVLVWFEPVSQPVEAPKGRTERKVSRKEQSLAAELKRELGESREQFIHLREEHDSAVEELQASNEEVQSINEELQSLNEELETSNEELESANEELTTLNEELSTRNSELRESELQLREQAHLLEMAPLLARSAKDRIVYWTRGAEQLYGFTREEAMGQTVHLLLQARYSIPPETIMAEVARTGKWEGEAWHTKKSGDAICVYCKLIRHDEGPKRTRAILEVHTDITSLKAAQESLRQSEEFNRRVLQSTPDCIKLLDLEGRLVFMSPGGQETMELADFNMEAANAYWPGIWEGESRQLAERAFHRALGGDMERFHGQCRTRTGRVKWWDVVVRPVMDSRGKPQRILASARDITQQKSDDADRDRHARLAVLRADVALETTRGGELVAVLQKVSETIAYQLEAPWVGIWTAPVGSETYRLIGSASRRPLPGAGRMMQAGDIDVETLATLKEPLVYASGSDDDQLPPIPQWAEQAGARSMGAFPLLSDGRTIGLLVLFSERTLDPATVNELTLSSDALGQYISRKTGETERNRLLEEAVKARNEAQAASRAKDDFLANLSHELRTPLNPVLMLASEEAENPNLPDNVRSIFDTIRNNVSIEAKLIDDLLDLTRIVHGKLSLEVEVIDAHRILKDVIEIVGPEVAKKRLEMSVDLRATRSSVLGDQVRLHQVLWNVLINATRYTPSGGKVTVETVNRGDGDSLAILISDTGMGIPPGSEEKLFTPFAQTEHRSGGLGLGLAISKHLVEKHGGTIKVVSSGVAKGATFEISLPIARSGTAATSSGDNDKTVVLRPNLRMSGRIGGDENRRRVLLIEDHAATRETLNYLLGRRNLEVVSASSAAEARLYAKNLKFDIVISDLGLPDGDGCEVWAELKALMPELVGIALSGYGMAEDIERSRAAGFNEHLTKPVDMNELDRAIATAEGIRDA